MKKQIILLGFLATTSLAFAQSGKVGINTNSPEATLDIKPSTANAAVSANTNEGVLIPRVSRARLNSIAPSNLKESTLVYVNDLTGAVATVTSNVTSKGFYYYSTADSKWVKMAEGVLQAQDLRLVGLNNHITQDAGKGGTGTDGGSFYNVGIGKDALYSITYGARNIAVGDEALYSTTDGVGNVAIGASALYNNQSGSHNIAIGNDALLEATAGGVSNIAIGHEALMSGGYGVAIGETALRASIGGGYNVAIGNSALRFNTYGRDNMAIGRYALQNNNTGTNNMAMGNSAMISNTTGNSNIGLGTGSLRSNTTGSNNIGMGADALSLNINGESNIGMGAGALYSNQSGNNNIGMGTNALRSNSSGRDNIALGSIALFSNTTGVNNIAIGSSGLGQNTTGNNNIAMGTSALRANTTGQRNIAIGESALYENTTGGYNIAMGVSTLSKNTIGASNVGIGVNALSNSTTGDSNIGIGNSALIANTTGAYNIGIGYFPLNKTTTGAHNIGLGYNSMEANTTGNYNLALGTYSLRTNTTGQHNSAFGLNALQNNVTGSGNTALGNGSGEWVKGNSNIHLGSANFPSAATAELDNVVAIGNGISATELTPSTGQDNTIILGHKNGHSFSPNVGIGTYKPDSKVHIVANGPNAIKIVDTNQGAGKVLTSDANGVGTWKEPAAPIADFARQYARTATDFDLQANVMHTIPGINDFVAPKTGKYLVLYHSFFQNVWETGTRNLYFVMLLNGGTWIDADETYSYVEERAFFNQHYSNVVGLTAGDVVSFRVIANRGKLRLNSAYAGRNRIEIVYLGQ